MKDVIKKILNATKKLDSVSVPKNNRFFYFFGKKSIIKGRTDNKGKTKNIKILKYE